MLKGLEETENATWPLYIKRGAIHMKLTGTNYQE
jgi:hypothetical protein